MKIHPLTLKDQPLISGYFKRFPPRISEFTFTNLFVWRSSRPMGFAEVAGSLLLFVVSQEQPAGKPILFGHPLGDSSFAELLAGIRHEIAGMVRFPEEFVPPVETAGFAVRPDRDNADYVYRVDDLASLAGRKFAKKRNHVKQCLEKYSCEYVHLTPEHLDACLAMQERWCMDRNCMEDFSLCSEYQAIQEAFENYERLGLFGGAVKVNGTIQAFALGERLNDNTAVCHFEKAMPGIDGLGQLINQWFARYSLEGFEFVNREQDLGLPGLRQAKESYHPDHMVEKYNVQSDLPLASLSAFPAGCSE